MKRKRKSGMMSVKSHRTSRTGWAEITVILAAIYTDTITITSMQDKCRRQPVNVSST